MHALTAPFARRFARVAVLLLASVCAHLPADPTTDLLGAAKAGPTSWTTLLSAKPDVNAQDAAGNTALHYAALAQDTAGVRALLRAGAKTNILNKAGASPLLYGATNSSIVTLLLAAYADPNVMSKGEVSPLLAAAANADSFDPVRRLVDAGANLRMPNSHGEDNTLATAIFGGDHRTINFLIARGVNLEPKAFQGPLDEAAWIGDMETVETLVKHGVKVDAFSQFSGQSANLALYGYQPKIAAYLFDHGASLTEGSGWGHGTPPMVWAAYSTDGDDQCARLLVAKGVDVNATNEDGETALSFAEKSCPESPLVTYLKGLGAKSFVASHEHPPANRPLPTPETYQTEVRARLQPALDLLVQSSSAFVRNPFVHSTARCVSCHQNYLPAVAVAQAKARGLKVDDAEVGRALAAQMSQWTDATETGRELNEPVPDAPVSLGYGFFALQALNHASDETTDVMATYLIRLQRTEGWWLSYDHRPPLEGGRLVATAWCAYAVKNFAPTRLRAQATACLAKTESWLSQQEPKTPDEEVFQVLGLHWCGLTPRELKERVTAIVSAQQANGGWAQLPGRECDAWATGTALFALREAGGFSVSNPVYRRGVEYLLKTQQADGTWWVRSRSWPFQPHFNGQFPYGKDQWVSAAGTSWALLAIMETLQVEPAYHPKGDQVYLAAFGRLPADPAKTAKATTQVASVDFVHDIAPILQKSCADCHSGKHPKGDLSLESRESLLKGGQSGESAVTPGYAEDSPLLQYVTDQVEDLEMPPLTHRNKYPALSPAQVERLHQWIEAGAPWPSTAPLKVPAAKTASDLVPVGQSLASLTP